MIEPLITALRIDKLDLDTVKVAFDIGSRDGKQALELADAFPQARVFAVECNPDTLPILRQNIQSNPRVAAIECAVSDYCGDVTFHKIDREATITPHADGNPGASSLFLAKPDYPQETYVQVPVTVPCQTLDAICAEHGIDSIDIIWMDLQGAEVKAFDGFKHTMQRTRYIFVELTHREIYAGQPLFDEVNAYLEARGFERISGVDRNNYFEDVIYRNRLFFQVENKHVVLEQKWGGLGDNLQLSTLPALYARQGIACYLSADNLTRNDEIRNLVWADNPFIRGTVNLPPTAGQINIEARLSDITIDHPFISRIELAHGLEARNTAPDLFRPARKIEGLQGKILLDLSSTSVTGGAEKLTRYVQSVLREYKYRLEDVVQVRFQHYSSPNNIQFSNLPEFLCESLYHYWDALYTVSRVITVHSGAQSLTVAMKGVRGNALERIHCYATPYQYNTRMYIYDSVDYYVE
jgi:FkbM family methyltransferase